MQQRFLLQILLLAQHVSGTTMPIIRSSRVLYSGCCLWYFVLWFSSCWSGVELRVNAGCCFSRMHKNCEDGCANNLTQYVRNMKKYGTGPGSTIVANIYIYLFICVCVCVCVCELQKTGQQTVYE